MHIIIHYYCHDEHYKIDPARYAPSLFHYSTYSITLKVKLYEISRGVFLQQLSIFLLYVVDVDATFK